MTDLIARDGPWWEERWTEWGLPRRYLEPGQAPDVIEAALVDAFGTRPDAGLVAWFAWQDGSEREWIAAPTGHRLLSLDDALLHRNLNLGVNMTQDATDEHVHLFDERWMPLTTGDNWLRLFHVDTGAVWAFDWWDPTTPVQVASSLHEAMVGWMGALDLGLFNWDDRAQRWAYDPRKLPEPFVRSRLLA